MFEDCLQKQEEIKQEFSSFTSAEERYQKIIDLGRSYTQAGPEIKRDDNRVHGCQSEMYVNASIEDGKIYFEAVSDALISLGLAVLLIKAYNGEPAEALFKVPPAYIQELGIPASLTPGRAVGLASLFKHMQKEAVRLMAAQS